jgi:phosphoglucomutase/phosphomannomutase
VEVARQVGADLILASDPDADRLAAVLPDASCDGGWRYLKGGQLAALMGDWVLDRLSAQGDLPERGLIARSLITSDLVDAVAESRGVRVVANLPVGFKYIGKVMSEAGADEQFLFGTEQSYGFLKGNYCRDKDAAVAALLLTEFCEHLRRSGETLVDALRRLWRRHGYHAERATPVAMVGVEGRRRIEAIMAKLRAGFPAELAGVRVTEMWDLLQDSVTDPAAGRRVRDLGWHWNEDVLMGRLAQDAKSSVSVRPSGTEPSLKVYTNVRAPVRSDVTPHELEEAGRAAEALAEALERDLFRVMGVE